MVRFIIERVWRGTEKERVVFESEQEALTASLCASRTRVSQRLSASVCVAMTDVSSLPPLQWRIAGARNDCSICDLGRQRMAVWLKACW